jgi:hypothetical protein
MPRDDDVYLEPIAEDRAQRCRVGEAILDDEHRRGCAFEGCSHGGHPVTDDDCPCERLSCTCAAVK